MKEIKIYLILLFFATASMTILDAQQNPLDSFEISGSIFATSGHPMPNVVVTLLGPQQTWVDTTGADGQYAFAEIPEKADYDIRFSKAGEELNGINENDLALLQNHILYLNHLNYYSFFAGDVTNSSGVSTLDIVVIARAILGLSPGFSRNWKFLYAYSDFEPGNPWGLPLSGQLGWYLDHYPVYQLSGNLRNIDFVGCKTGDTDQTANPFE